LVISKNKDERENSNNPDCLDVIICIGRSGRSMKDNLLDKLAKKESEIKIVEILFKKI